MNILTNIVIAVVSSAVMFIAGVNLPASNFSLSKFTEPILGVFTEISTATNLADFPATYNANLNKTIEVGTTSVASITTLENLSTTGTIISGTWNGTAIGVGYGGTGTTSPSTYMVMLGNGANGLTMASSTGTAGQFMTSNGPGAYPSFQTSAVDQGIDYNFTSSAFRVKNLHASSTVANPITLNGVPYSFPSANGVAGSVAVNNGSGALSWGVPPQYSFATTTAIVTTTSATTTALVIPAGVLTASSTIQVMAHVKCVSNSSCRFSVRESTGNSTTFIGTNIATPASGRTWRINPVVNIFANNSTSAQVSTMYYMALDTGTVSAIVPGDSNDVSATSAFDTANPVSIVGVIEASGSTATLYNMSIVVHP